MKRIVMILVALFLVGCASLVVHLDTKWMPAKYAGFNWQEGKFPVDETEAFGTLNGKLLFTERTGRSKWMTPEEYCAQWEEEAVDRDCLSGTTISSPVYSFKRFKCAPKGWNP